jgi:hypothetical protein
MLGVWRRHGAARVRRSSPETEGVVRDACVTTSDAVAAWGRADAMKMRGAPQTRRRRATASVAVAFVVVCAIGARAALGQTSPAPGDTYANSEYYNRDIGVEAVDLQGNRFCFPESARHQRPDVPEMFLRSKIPLEVRCEREK